MCIYLDFTKHLKPQYLMANVGRLCYAIQLQSNMSKLFIVLKTEPYIVDPAPRKLHRLKAKARIYSWGSESKRSDMIHNFNDGQGYCMACWKE